MRLQNRVDISAKIATGRSCLNVNKIKRKNPWGYTAVSFISVDSEK